MATIFSRIISGELPGYFVWRDERCVAFLSIHPLRPGHTLVVTRDEIDHWLDMDIGLLAHVTGVAHAVGKAIQAAFQPAKVGMMLAGLEVPHVHFHLVPIDAVHDLDFSNQDLHAKPDDLARAAGRIRTALRSLGYKQAADS